MGAMLWLASLVVGAAPRRLWDRLDPPFPIFRSTISAGIFTFVAGCTIGIRGFFSFAGDLAAANNDWMLRRLVAAPLAGDQSVGLVPYGISVLTVFVYLFTPTGLLAVYLAGSGVVRAAAAYTDPDDARGDFVLTGIDRAWTTFWSTLERMEARAARLRREGLERPDLLQTGEWAGVDADYVVLASRRKAEWTAGAIIMTSAEWYKLGVPFDIETPAGLRTAYPLTRMETVEVLRRGIRYELPRLQRSAPGTLKKER